MALHHGSAPLLDVLWRRAEREPERVGYLEAVDGDEPLRGLSYARLAGRVEEVATALRAGGVRPGERVALALPGGLEYLVRLLGCLAAGAVAVPLPPRARARDEDESPRARLAAHPVVRASGAVAAFTAPDLLDLRVTADLTHATPAPEGVAVLQYTSGSTGVPKGVMVTHDSIAHNLAAITSGMSLTEADRGLVWLPPYHDMGLFGGLLSPVWSGMSMTLLSTEAFARRPLSWLRLVSEHRVTLSGGPNFAFDACVDRIPAQERAALDLSAWEIAFVGAEPVRARTLRRFAEAFAVAGFRPEAFYPCYGMAETTLIISGGRRGGGLRTLPPDRPRRPEQVSCGPALGGLRVRAVDPDTGVEMPPGDVGELVVSGPSVTRGYWRDEAATAAVYGSDGLRTGDLGRIVDGEVYLTGRRKDTIVVRGRNLAPEDIEEVARAADPALSGSVVAAFAVDDGTERLVLAAETPTRGPDAADPGPLLARLRAAIGDAFGVQPHAVLAVRRGSLPRTTSGKVRRSVSRDRYLEGTLRVLAEDRLRDAPAQTPPLPSRAELDALPTDERVAAVAAALRARLAAFVAPSGERPDDLLDGDASPVAAGLDSLAMAQLHGDLTAAWDVGLPMSALSAAASVTELAGAVVAHWPTGTGPGVRPGAQPGQSPDDETGESIAEANLAATRYLEQRRPGTSMYVLGRAFRLPTDADLDALRATLRLLGARHPALLGTPPGRSTPTGELPLHTVDARGRDRAEVAALVQAAARAPFGPGEARLRATVVDAGVDRFLALAAHHTAVDLWSASILVGEFAAAYRAFAAGRTPELPPSGPPPGATTARGADRAALRDWWARTLREHEDAALPVDRTGGGAPGGPAGAVRGLLPGVTRDDVARAAAALGTTPFTVLFTAVTAVLGGYCGAGAVTVGVPVAARTDPAVRNTVGFLANTLPIRVETTGAVTAADLTARAHAAITGALDHHELPFAQIVVAAGASRPDGRNPLFDVMFVHHTPPPFAPSGTAALALGAAGERLDLGGLVLTAEPVLPTDAQVPLCVEVAHTDAGTAIQVRYAADLFDPETATAIGARCADAVRRVVADPAVPLDALLADDTVTAPAAAAVPAGPDLLARIDRVRRRDAVAVRHGARSLTYAALERHSTEVARRLRRLGVGPEVVVGVAVSRTERLPLALLGILRAGGAYCPLDLTLPPARLAAVLDEARPTVVVTESALVDRVPTGPRRLLLDDPHDSGDGAAGLPPPLPPAVVHPDQLAYVLFTSGSTGRPKSVALTHRGLAAFAAWGVEAYRADEWRGVLAGTPLSFDLSVFELLVPLAAGGTVVVAGHALDLPRLPGREHLTLLNTVPSIAAHLLLDGLPAGAGTVNLAGEPLPARLAAELHRQGVRRVVNLYGPTEATTYATGGEVDPSGSRLVDIGTGLPAVTAVVRTPSGRPAGDGVVGELHLGGPHLARGYLGRPAGTAELFVPDPAGGGRREYRSGDLARRRPDGTLLYLGRTDRQVKVRGVRIELDEVEVVVGAYPGVAEAAVGVHRPTASDALLVAYVTGAATDAELREHAAARLPATMVPARWIRLDRLPRNRHGKLDRAALAAVPVPAAEPGAERPASPTERLVAGVWAEVLGTDRPTPDTDFVGAGGHSLLAMRLVARLEERTGARITLDRLFDAPTVAGVAALVEKALVATTPVLTEPVETVESHPLTFTQERMWLLHALDPDSAAYHVAAEVRFDGPLDGARLERALRSVVDRHAGLRAHLALDGAAQRVLPADGVPWVALPAHDVPADDADALVARLAREPFDLTAAPPWRIRLLRVAPERHRLVFVAHHAICDGWSLELLAGDLTRAYRTDAPLPAAGSVAHVAAAQRRRWADTGRAELDWWRERLDGLPALRLPAHRRPAGDARRPAGQVHHELPADVTAGLTALARTVDATPFTALAALLAAALGGHAGQDRFGIGMAVAGRSGAGTADVFGCLANTVVLRADLTGAPSMRELVTRMRRELVGALAHGDAPFADVVRAAAAGSAATTPLFQVMLGDQPADVSVDLDGVTARTVPLSTGTAKFDLSVLTETLPGGAVRLAVEFDAEMFDAATVQRFTERAGRLAAAAVDAPDQPLSHLPLADAADLALVDDWGDGGPLPDLGTGWLHEAVLTAAARVPDRIAVAAAGVSLTYRALRRRVAQLAAGLRARGIGTEDLVAICHSRTVDLPVAMLGVLAAGAAYLPVRDNDPPERRAAMLHDARARLVLADAETASWLDGYGVPVVSVDELVATPESATSTADPAPLVDPRQLAYVLYTSGSTGRPKGVGVTHEGALARIGWGIATFDRHELAGLLAATSIVFDLSLFELFTPLTAGGTVVLAESVLDLPALPDRDRVTMVTTVPSGMSALLDIDGWPATVHTVGLGGEALSPRLARRVWERGPRRVVNLYGTTEDSFCSTWVELHPDDVLITTGRPLPGSRVVVANAALLPVPPGVPGEIVSAGAGVSRGYLGRPGLTADVFVPDPAGPPGHRQYRTGDHGRWTAAGLEVAGRLDHQVKIRGHRVELGEVEAAIAAVPGVAETVALVDGVPGASTRRLVAFVRPDGEHGVLDTAGVRAELRRRLPDYMVPAAFVFLDVMPRTPSGKLDRAALAALPISGAEGTAAPGDAPRGQTETEVALLWQGMTGASRVTRDDRFFELGGDSLLAARMTTRLNDRFGVAVPLRQIFEDDRLAAFARRIDEGLRAG
ncbi:non-ribosomal peptide synthetase [Micromonospora robiginosa]|uniref:Non-ribosomal peptide synthetase n=1 Tax=Micromonospora robiginosa TaxID=2749844 RepID=A0A7L6B4F1_9ACTN|nr:non-ribosomal peptide synthetase [Micromonospora ferruginea]QLQ36675.1 non-ribosomal peptide synthetase [Micromonospora ferruginea]